MRAFASVAYIRKYLPEVYIKFDFTKVSLEHQMVNTVGDKLDAHEQMHITNYNFTELWTIILRQQA